MTAPPGETTLGGARERSAAREPLLERAPAPPARHPAGEPPARAIRHSWQVLAASFGLLAIVATARLVSAPTPADWLVAALLVAGGIGGAWHFGLIRALEASRRGEVESFARILWGLSRSVSPEAIVNAIVEELGDATAADHVVVIRRLSDGRPLEATLVTRRAGVPSSTSLMPFGDLEGPIWPDDADAIESDQAIADRLAARAGVFFGLKHLVAVPLRTIDGIVGAIVLSRRTDEPWPPAARRLLASAAVEASAALTRATSHRAAQTLASTDPLTGLPNRRYFDEFCDLLSRRRRVDDRVGVLMIDIDHFKRLNDRHGHAAGDAVLRAVGGAIGRAIREQDVPARYGGEEFAILVRAPSREIAAEIGERVRSAVRALDLARLGVPATSVSVGVAVPDTPDEPIAATLDRADRALYDAKRRGRNRVVVA